MNHIPANQAGFRNPVTPAKDNTLSQWETEQGWELLFDGKSTQGWRKFNDTGIGNAWRAVGGTLLLDNSRKVDGQIVGGGDIVTEQEYKDFELTLDWKIQSGGNSGLMYYVVDNGEYDRPYKTGPEMQILDNIRHPDGRIETHRSGDLYDMIPCKFVTANGPGEWNHVRIVSKDGKISHWQNGYKVVEFTMHTPAWEQMVQESKFSDWEGFGKARQGHIALQDHGDKVWFKNIKIRKL